MPALIVQCPACPTQNNIPFAKQHLAAKCGRCKARLEPTRDAVPVPLTDTACAAFIETAPLPLLVDFYSPTCAPCLMLAPVIDRLAKRYWGKVIIAKLDTSRSPASAARYQINGVPTLLFFKNGVVVDRVVGALPEPQLIDKIEALRG